MIYFANYQFGEPKAFLNWTSSEKEGIFAILIKNPESKSKPYKAIYFGESENLSEQGFFRSYHRYDCWIREAGNETDLYISVFPTPGSTPNLRQGIKTFLVKYYHPVCNF